MLNNFDKSELRISNLAKGTSQTFYSNRSGAKQNRVRAIMTRFKGKDRFEGLLSLRAQLLFFAAVFMIFATIGLLVSHGFSVSRTGQTFIWIIYYGFVAVCWAWSFSKDKRLLFFVVPISLVAPHFIGPGHLTFDDVVMIALIVASFVLLIYFAAVEWPRSLRLQTEISLARELHSRLVPTIDQRIAGLEIYGTSSSCTEVGGDLLDVFEHDTAVDLYLADVSGHGIAAGTLMAMTKSAIRMRIRDVPALDDLIADLNEVVTEVRKKGMFVTFAALRVDEKGRAEYGLAGHLPIVHFRPSTGVLDHLGDPALPLGAPLQQQKAAYKIGYIEVEHGDIFLLLSDGLTEVHDQEGKELGTEPIEEIIKRYHDEPLLILHDRILLLVEGYGPQEDDRTLLLARVLKRNRK